MREQNRERKNGRQQMESAEKKVTEDKSEPLNTVDSFMAGISKPQESKFKHQKGSNLVLKTCMHIQIWRHDTGSMENSDEGGKSICYHVHVPWHEAPAALGGENHKPGLTL